MVQAANGVLQGVLAALTGSRSATIEIDNNTELSLTLLHADWDSGGPVKLLDPVIAPGAAIVFGAQNLGGSVMTGTVGSVQYATSDSSLWLWVKWGNPYLGANYADARLGWDQMDQYMVRYQVGCGNTQAQFRFMLLPNTGGVYPRIKDITNGGFL